MTAEGRGLLEIGGRSIAAVVLWVVSSGLSGVAPERPLTNSAPLDGLPCPDVPSESPRWINLGLTAPELPSDVVAPPRFEVRQIAVDPVRANRLWVATSYGLFRTSNGGASWQLVLIGTDGAFGLAVDPSSPSNVLAADSQKISRSSDGGETWPTVQYAHIVRAIEFDPMSPSLAYAGASYALVGGVGTADPGLVYRSSDGGGTWTVPDPTFQPFTVWDLLVGTRTPGFVVAATQNGIFRSLDRGQSWTRADAPGSFLATGVATNPDAGGILISTASNGYFDGTTLGTVLRSEDGGVHFETLFTGFGLTAIVVDPLFPLTVYAAGSSGVIRSSDGGITWHFLTEGLTDLFVTALAIDSRTGSVFAGTRTAGVFRFANSRKRVARCRSVRVIGPRR